MSSTMCRGSASYHQCPVVLGPVWGQHSWTTSKAGALDWRCWITALAVWHPSSCCTQCLCNPTAGKCNNSLEIALTVPMFIIPVTEPFAATVRACCVYRSFWHQLLSCTELISDKDSRGFASSTSPVTQHHSCPALSMLSPTGWPC